MGKWMGLTEGTRKAYIQLILAEAKRIIDLRDGKDVIFVCVDGRGKNVEEQNEEGK